MVKIISVRGPILDATITQQRIGHRSNVIKFIHEVSQASTWISKSQENLGSPNKGLQQPKIVDVALTG